MSFPLMNSFNKTESAISPMQTMLPCDFLFSQINILPVTTSYNLKEGLNRIPFYDIITNSYL